MRFFEPREKAANQIRDSIFDPDRMQTSKGLQDVPHEMPQPMCVQKFLKGFLFISFLSKVTRHLSILIHMRIATGYWTQHQTLFIMGFGPALVLKSIHDECKIL